MPSSGELIGLGETPRLAGLIGNLPSAKTGVGTAQAGATPITTNFTVLTASGGNTAFILPAVPAGSGPYICINQSGTTALVFGQTGENIQGGGVNASFSVANNKCVMFFKISSTLWAANLTA
jgi:hypothetical protein